MAGGVVNRRQLINIGKGVVRANDPHLLKEFGGHVDLSKDWAKRIFKKLNWKKRKATTGNKPQHSRKSLPAKISFFGKTNLKKKNQSRKICL